VHQKENPQKPLAKVEKNREEMQTTLEDKKKLQYTLQEVLSKGRT